MSVKCTCLECSKSVRINQKALYCDNCLQWVHLKCTKLTSNDYSNLSRDNSNWFCEICLSKIFHFNSIVDEFEFLCCIYNYSYTDKINTEIIKNAKQLELVSNLSICDNDIDLYKYIYGNYRNLGNTYYLENDFNHLVVQNSIDSNFSLLHMNIRSLSKNYDQLIVYLSCLKHRFSIIDLSETWTNENNQSLFPIPGYKCLFKNRIDGRGGRVYLYVLDFINFYESDDLNAYANVKFECVFIELSDTQFGRKVVGSVYRPPDNNLDVFNKGFDCVLNSTVKSKIEYLIAEDYNIDLLKHTTHEGTSIFLNNIYTHSLLPIITRPTRFGAESSTLIDNIFINKLNKSLKAGILLCEISDYLPIFYISPKCIQDTSPTYITISTRSITDNNILKFKSALQSAECS